MPERQTEASRNFSFRAWRRSPIAELRYLPPWVRLLRWLACLSDDSSGHTLDKGHYNHGRLAIVGGLHLLYLDPLPMSKQPEEKDSREEQEHKLRQGSGSSRCRPCWRNVRFEAIRTDIRGHIGWPIILNPARLHLLASSVVRVSDVESPRPIGSPRFGIPMRESPPDGKQLYCWNPQGSWRRRDGYFATK